MKNFILLAALACLLGACSKAQDEGCNEVVILETATYSQQVCPGVAPTIEESTVTRVVTRCEAEKICRQYSEAQQNTLQAYEEACDTFEAYRFIKQYPATCKIIDDEG